MKKILGTLLLGTITFSSMYAAGATLNVDDLNCLRVEKQFSEQYKNICVPSKKPENCSTESYDKLKASVKECNFKIIGSLRSAF
ncbi:MULTISPECIES: hypothetical protein [unclassified Francisella]|uniref:hypothetical protein n=1 Tax=unclassified Francisella TaxID=2610885 RepID=UPI002E306DAF|nr:MULTISPECIES: hypothetical protein [unclassified Francisella]MED7819870.1 hypothetical protein [Francisella sp. 19S2-4]MED7830666.1 hypothetical protein [Francisella sp. 19S2-10]